MEKMDSTFILPSRGNTQMHKFINICYIDDNIDSLLSRYIDEYCVNFNLKESHNYECEFTEYTFNKEDSYKTLLENNSINKSNIIVIDSRLFENKDSSLSKFTGEQFKVILRQVLPFIKTIVISQNFSSSESLTLQKFQSTRLNVGEFRGYYDTHLKPILDRDVIATIEEHEILNQLSSENEVDEVLVATIQSTIAGIRDTALFEKKGLDELIKLFNEVKIKYGE